jgi:hypothetical protein
VVLALDTSGGSQVFGGRLKMVIGRPSGGSAAGDARMMSNRIIILLQDEDLLVNLESELYNSGKGSLT